MKRALALLLLLATSAWADSTNAVTRGGALKKRAYQTYATATYYVDPTGSDSNPCTASGTDACATLGGALAKLPRFVRNTTTINVAAGTYSGGVTVTDLNMTGVLTIAGTMSNYTVATGTNSGTTTASSAGSSSGPATITDSGQSWTTNDLRGRFITFTSGTFNGQSFPIYANTATTVTFPSASNAGTGVTYTIQTPGTIFAGGSSGHTFSNLFGNAIMAVNNIEWTRTSGGAGVTFGAASTVNFTSNRFIQAGSSAAFNQGSGAAQLTRAYVESSIASAFGVQSANATTAFSTRTTIANSVVRMTSATNTIAVALSNNVVGATLVSGSILEASGTNGPVLLLSALGTGAQMPSLWVYCTSASGIGIGANTISSSVPPVVGTYTSNGNTRVTGCATGVRVQGNQTWTFLSPAFDTCTTAFSVEKGGRLDLISGTPTFTGVTNELSLDGTAYTLSTLTGLPSPQVITNSYGSTIIR